MNSLGSSSKWPSYDSLPSTSSFLLSESEQTEDEADVFSEGEGDVAPRNPLAADEGVTTLSGRFLRFPPRPDQQRSDKTKHPDSASSPGAAAYRSAAATPGDLAFAQKCADLHRFVHPLVELLQGLKTGRFDRGLTSFQQSVAIDRLQRILGVLQKPEMGEKYLHNLLQIEVLLKMWFPQVAFKSAGISNQSSAPEITPHWRQNQLHMPVKKRKLSWSDPDQAVPSIQSSHAEPLLHTVSSCRPASPKKQKVVEQEATGGGGAQLTDRAASMRAGRESAASLASLCGSPATQDNSVSSSNTVTTTDSP